jgi:hypothetical protein
LKGQASLHVAADDVETGIGPVLTLEDLRVRWTFIGLMVRSETGGRFEVSLKEDESDDCSCNDDAFEG